MTPSYTFASIANPYDATIMRSNPLALVLPLLQCMHPIQDEEGAMAHVRQDIKLSFTTVRPGSGSSPRSLRETWSDLIHSFFGPRHWASSMA
jgi:hypothetical protein